MAADLSHLLRVTADRPVHDLDADHVVGTGRRRRRRHRAGGLVAVVAIIAVGVVGTARSLPLRPPPVVDQVPGSSADRCPVTVPDGGFRPPAEFPPPSDGQQWYGTEDLWILLDADGAVWHGPAAGDHLTKLPLWSIHQRGPSVEPEPDVTVMARRLDRESPPVRSGPTTHGWGPMPLFMLTGLELPTAGCWQLSATYREATLRWVVAVLPDTVVVPDVEGMTLHEAHKHLHTVGLEGGPVSGPGWSDPATDDVTVVSQAPPHGTEVAPGTPVGFRTAVVTDELCAVLTELPFGGDAQELARRDGYRDVLQRARPHAPRLLAAHLDRLLGHLAVGGALDDAPGRTLDVVSIHHTACSRFGG